MTKKLQIIILIVVSFLMYSNTLKNPFIWDDKGIIEDLNKPEYQKHLKNPFFFLTPSYWKEYTKFHDVDAYVPVSPIRILSLNIDYKIWGNKTTGYHLTNIFIHIANVILVYLLIISIFGSQKLAFFSALIFSVHPMHTESINWIKNRIDMIATFFMMLSFLFFVRFEKEKKNFWFYIVSIISFFFALLSKEISVTLVGVIIAYAIYFVPKENWEKTSLLVIPYFIMSIIYFVVTQIMLKKGLNIPAISRLDIYTNVLLVFKTIAYYIKLLIFPFRFNLDRDIDLPKFLFEPGMIFSTIAVFVSLWAVYYFYKKNKVISFFILWFFITISPVSNIIYLAPRPIAEQRLYLSSIGYSAILVSLIYYIYEFFRFNKEIFVKIIIYGVSCVFFISGFIRNFDWQDEARLWESVVKTSPFNARAWVNYGEAYYLKGEIEKSRECFEKALDIAPDFAMANRGLAFYYFKKGDAQKAIFYFRKSGDVN